MTCGIFLGQGSVTRVYVPQLLSHHNKDLEWWTLKPPRHVTVLGSWTDRVIALRSWTDHVIALRQISVTAPFYLDNSRKIHLRGVRACRPKDRKGRMPQHAGGGRERERPLALWLLFLYVTPPPPLLPSGLPFVNWASQECCLFYLRSSLQSSDLPLTFLCSIFAGFPLPCLLATTILGFCFLF